ncbi:MAG: DUF1294 domain-containing protein [Bacilli bacterium]|nr:DUF1294 domain-containing protein [Bacilli bacterium]
MTFQQYLLIGYVIYLIIMSLITMFLFIKDKAMAKQNGNEVRIKEKTLLGFTCFGGAIGAFIGRILAHHKTNKGYFSFTIIVSLLLQVAVLGLIVLKAMGAF